MCGQNIRNTSQDRNVSSKASGMFYSFNLGVPNKLAAE